MAFQIVAKSKLPGKKYSESYGFRSTFTAAEELLAKTIDESMGADPDDYDIVEVDDGEDVTKPTASFARPL